MSDLVISSTTDTEDQMNLALVHGTELAEDSTTLAVIDRATGEPIEEVAPVVITTPPEENAAEVKAAEEKPEVKVETKVPKEKPKREDFATDDEFERAQLGYKANKRIDRLTWERGEQQRRADALQAELDALKGRKVERPPPPAVAEQVRQVEAVAEADEIQKAVDASQVALAAVDQKLLALGKAPKLEDHESIEKWEEATLAWQDQKMDLREERAKVKAKIETFAVIVEERKADAAVAAAEDRNAQIDSFMASRKDAETAIPDFSAVIAANSDMEMSPTMQYVAITSPIGHRINYYLATHRDEAQELFDLGDTPEALRMIGGIEREVRKGMVAAQAPVETRQTEVPPRAVTQTPEPIAPVGGRATAVSRSIDQITDQSEFKALRNRQEFERSRRARR